MDFKVRTKTAINYGKSPLGKQKTAILEMVVDQILFNRATQTVQARVLVATEAGDIVDFVPVPFKMANFKGIFGAQTVSGFLDNTEQLLIATIESMNAELTAQGKEDELVFYGLRASDMELVALPQQTAPEDTPTA